MPYTSVCSTTLLRSTQSPMSTPQEFQVVVLAGGCGHRLAGLTPRTPKALLPVAGRPLLWYSLKSLENAGFPEVILAVGAKEFTEIKDYLESLTEGPTDYQPTGTAQPIGIVVNPPEETSKVAPTYSSVIASKVPLQPYLHSETVSGVFGGLKVEVVAIPSSSEIANRIELENETEGDEGQGKGTGDATCGVSNQTVELKSEQQEINDWKQKRVDGIHNHPKTVQIAASTTVERSKHTSAELPTCHDGEEAIDVQDEEYEVGDEDECIGTAEALHLLTPKIKTDVFVVSCDIVGHVNYRGLADLHRISNGACTMLCIEKESSRNPKDVKGKVVHTQSEDNSWVVLDEDNNRVVAIKDSMEVHLQGGLTMDKLQLFWHPDLTLRTNTVDLHAYVFSHSALQLLGNPSLCFDSIQHDFVPLLVKMQNAPQADAWSASRLDCDDLSSRLWDMCPWNNEKNSSEGMESHSKKEHLVEYSAAEPPKRPLKGTQVSVFVQASKAENAIRINSAAKHHEVNMQFCTPKSEEGKSLIPVYLQPVSYPLPGHNLKECIIGPRLVIQDKNVVIKRCVIGKDVIVESGVKLSNCVIGDGVIVKKEAKLQGCTICDGSVIEASSKLTCCRVARGVLIAQSTEAKNEEFLIREMKTRIANHHQNKL